MDLEEEEKQKRRAELIKQIEEAEIAETEARIKKMQAKLEIRKLGFYF